MENMFEKTMLTCLESRNIKKQSKLNESYKKVKKLTEADEADLSYELPEEEDQEVMDDIQDDVVVVVDPELDEDDIENAAADAQEIIDGTPEGEVPTTDEYIGDMTYTCPICGNTFFSEVEMKGGDQCPVCGDAPSAYVLVGEVAESDDADPESEDEYVDKSLEPEDEGEPNPEDEPIDEPDEELETEDETEELDIKETEEESKKPIVKKKECADESCKKEAKKPVAPKCRFQIDESTFNPYMNKFIRENYKNARSFRVVGATLNKNRVLTLECKITFKSGNSKNVKLKTEGFRAFNGKKAYVDFKENGAFKTEATSKVSPFIFTVSMKNNVMKCEGLKYNFKSKISESKKAHVYGKVVMESRRPVAARKIRK